MTTPTWDVDQDLAFWAEAGITNVGVALRKMESVGLPEAVERIASSGVSVTNLLGLGFDLTDHESWPKHQARMAAAVNAAADLGAGCFVLTTGSARAMTWERAADRLALALDPVISEARRLGVPFALEHTNSLRVDVGFVHTLRDVNDLAADLGIGVVMECNACWAERDLATAIANAAERLCLVQVSDFVIGTHRTPDRAVPGDGDVPLLRLLREVLDAGYDGVFDLEILGPRMEAEGYASAVPRAVKALEGLLAELGVAS